MVGKEVDRNCYLKFQEHDISCFNELLGMYFICMSKMNVLCLPVYLLQLVKWVHLSKRHDLKFENENGRQRKI